MSLVISRPIANDNTPWNINSYTFIDDVVTYSDDGDAGDTYPADTYIQGSKGDAGEEQIYLMEAPSSNGLVTSIDVYFRVAVAFNASNKFRIYVDGTPSEYQNYAWLETVNGWGIFNFTGTWSFSASTVLKVGILTGWDSGYPNSHLFDVIYLQYESTNSYTPTVNQPPVTQPVVSGTSKIGRGYYTSGSGITMAGYARVGIHYLATNNTEPTIAGWAKSGRSYSPTGGATLSGTCKPGIGIKGSLTNIQVSGTAIYSSLSYQYETTGGVTLSGYAFVGIHYTGVGGTQPTLSGQVKIGIGIPSSGGITMAGQGKPRIGFRPSDGVTMAGQGMPRIGFRPSGGVTLSGIAKIDRRQTATGGVDVAGFAITLDPTSALGSGFVTVSGSGVVRIAIRFIVGSTEGRTRMAQTGANGGGGTIAWDSPGNITTLNGSFAATGGTGVVTNSTSQFLHATNFNFDIPNQSIFLGLIGRLYNTGATQFGGSGIFQIIEVVLIKNGTRSLYNISNTEFLTMSGVTYTYGDNTNTWGENPTGAEISASNFGIAVRVNHTTTGGFWGIGTDAINATLYFVTPVTLSGQCKIGISIKGSGGIATGGTALCRISGRHYIGQGGIDIAGESLVKNINPLRHFANGTINVGGSMFLRFYQHTATGGIDINGDSNEIWEYILRAGQAVYTWSDNFNRADNTNIG